MLTQARLKERLHYYPETGVFTWKRTGSSDNRPIGSEAGYYGTKGYRYIGIDYKKYGSHRLAWLYVYGVTPYEIDHINRVKDDNRIANLRSVSDAQNSRNLPMRKDNASGYNGVGFHVGANKWVAYVQIDGKRKHLGCFTDVHEAGAVAKAARDKQGYSEAHGDPST